MNPAPDADHATLMAMKDVSKMKPGWKNYSSGNNTLWFDNVAFGASHIGYGAQKGGLSL